MAQLSPFQLFGLKPAFTLNAELLETRYQAAMMKVHPDRFADRPAAERRVAEQWSARINEAADLLRSPVRRAAWLCENAGFPVGAETNTAMPADFLMTQIEWREALEEAGDDQGKIASIFAQTDVVRGETLARLADAVDGRADWQAAVDITRRLMFIERFLEEVSKKVKH